MTDVLDVVGLLALALGAFLVAVWFGFVVLGAGCLWSSWSMSRKRRLAAEADLAKRPRITA